MSQFVKVTVKNRTYEGMVIEVRLDKLKVQFNGKQDWFDKKDVKRIWK